LTAKRPTADRDLVRDFWEANPVAAARIDAPIGSPEFFAAYDRLRERNESVEFSRRLHEFDRFTGQKVLDVGCGNGYVLSRYAGAGANVYGVDITGTAIELTKRRFEFLHLEGDFRVADAEHLPFADQTFDCVTCMGVLHHVPDTERSVAEIRRVLKPGGLLIAMVYHRNSALYRIRFPIDSVVKRKSIQQLVNEVDGVGNRKGDVYSRAELRGLLADFDALELEVGVLQPWMVIPGGNRLISIRWLRPFERRLGWFLYAKARKPQSLGSQPGGAIGDTG
jgi:ubiquinone/menaquinone biosynthesis C-methylase UbiE